MKVWVYVGIKDAILHRSDLYGLLEVDVPLQSVPDHLLGVLADCVSLLDIHGDKHPVPVLREFSELLTFRDYSVSLLSPTVEAVLDYLNECHLAMCRKRIGV